MVVQRVLDRSPEPILTDWSCAEFNIDIRSLMQHLGHSGGPWIDQSVPVQLEEGTP